MLKRKRINHIFQVLVYFLLCLTLLSISFLPGTIKSAKAVSFQNERRVESINPDLVYRYKLKRLFEKTNLFILSYINHKEKPLYLAKLTDKRLSEFKYITENSKMAFFEQSSSRYVTFIGLLTNELKYNPSFTEEIKNIIQDHPENLTGLRDRYPSDSAEWRFVQQALESSQVFLSNIR